MSLSIFDRIEIAMSVSRGERQFRKEQVNFKKEQKRANRAAGDNKNNGTNPDSNTGKKTSFDSKDKSNMDKNQQPVEQKKDNPAAEEPKKAEQKDRKKKDSAAKEPQKTEQQIKAEAQAPEEPAGAEKINKPTIAHTVVESEPQAAMNSVVRVDDSDPSHMDFSYFGDMSINLDKMNGGPGTSGNLFNQQPTQQPAQRSFNPVVSMMGSVPSGPMMAHQFDIDPTMGGMNTYGQMLNHQQVPVYQTPQGIPVNPVTGQQPQQQFVHPVGHGNHRVDVPEKPKPPKAPKSKPDVIDMEGMPNVIDGVEVTHFPKFKATTIGVVDDAPIMEAEPIPLVNRFKENNAQYFKEFPFLVEVEKIALDNGYQIGFIVRPTKLIDCYIYSDNNVMQPIQGKGFTIDPGMIIDHRKKVFACIAPFYEGNNAYPLFIPGKPENGKKGSNTLNVELLTNLIVGGNMTVQGVKGMYTDDFRNLNKYVALITMPTSKNGPEDRKYMQKRLVDLYKGNIYEDALMGSNARFRVAEYIKSSGTILLDTAGVPSNYGGETPNADRVQIKISRNDCRVLRGDNIIDVIPESQQ